MSEMLENESYIAAVDEFIPGDYGKAKKPHETVKKGETHATDRMFAQARETQERRMQEAAAREQQFSRMFKSVLSFSSSLPPRTCRTPPGDKARKEMREQHAKSYKQWEGRSKSVQKPKKTSSG